MRFSYIKYYNSTVFLLNEISTPNATLYWSLLYTIFLNSCAIVLLNARVSCIECSISDPECPCMPQPLTKLCSMLHKRSPAAMPPLSLSYSVSSRSHSWTYLPTLAPSVLQFTETCVGNFVIFFQNTFFWLDEIFMESRWIHRFIPLLALLLLTR